MVHIVSGGREKYAGREGRKRGLLSHLRWLGQICYYDATFCTRVLSTHGPAAFSAIGRPKRRAELWMP